MRIGLFGGTFDPIHIGHMIIMENVINFMNLDKIYILPNSNPPHKLKNEKTNISLRLKMIEKSIKNNPKLIIDDYDFKDNKIHYTYKTINHLHLVLAFHIFPHPQEFHRQHKNRYFLLHK